MLLVCFDGGEALVVDKLLAAGRLPALGGLLARGCAVSSVAAAPLLEECAWGTFLSGLPVGDVALAHFLEFDPATMGLVFRRELTAPGLWEHLPASARRVVLDPPELHVLAGSTVEASCGWHVFGEPVHAPLYTSERLQRTLERAPQPPLPDAARVTTAAEDRVTSATLAASAAGHFAAALEAGRDADFLCIGGQELHATTHCLAAHWVEGHWHAPPVPEPELVERVYEAVDAALVPLIAAFEDANVAVVFTHGMRPGNRAAGLLEGFLERAGLLVRSEAATPRADLGWATQRLRTLVPERVRAAVARRLPRELQHRLASRRFRESYRWSETRMIAPPAWTTGFLRANVRGREAAGIVRPEELDALLDEVASLLLEVENAETGAPLVRAVERARDLYPGALAGTLPDLLVDWAGDRPATRARHPRLGEWEGPLGTGHYWTSHSERALVLFAGPDVRHTEERLHGDAAGLAPTLLRLCGTEPPAQLTGTPWDVGAR
jgi:hypothetical protein